MKAVPEGSRIICSNKLCAAPLFQFVKQFNLGDHLTLDYVSPLRPDAVRSVDFCTCPTCGHVYMSNGAIHTHFGWFPYDP